MTLYRIAALLAGVFLILSGPVLAKEQQASPSYTLSQATAPASQPADTTTQSNTETVPFEKPDEAAPPVTTNTRVEIRNEAPPANKPADINIKMPDVNVAAPATTHTDKTTVTEHTTIITDNKPEPTHNDNFMYVIIFGILVLLIGVGVLVALTRRRSIEMPL